MSNNKDQKLCIIVGTENVDRIHALSKMFHEDFGIYSGGMELENVSNESVVVLFEAAGVDYALHGVVWNMCWNNQRMFDGMTVEEMRKFVQHKLVNEYPNEANDAFAVVRRILDYFASQSLKDEDEIKTIHERLASMVLAFAPFEDIEYACEQYELEKKHDT